MSKKNFFLITFLKTLLFAHRRLRDFSAQRPATQRLRMTAFSRNHPEPRLLRLLATAAETSTDGAEEGYGAEAARLCREQLSTVTGRLRQWLNQHTVPNGGNNVALLLDTLKFNYSYLLEPLINNSLAESLVLRERAPEFFDWLALVLYDFGEGLPDWNAESAEYLRWDRLEAAMRLLLSRFATTDDIERAATQLMSTEENSDSVCDSDERIVAQLFVALASQTEVWSLQGGAEEAQLAQEAVRRGRKKRKESAENGEEENGKKRKVRAPTRFGFEEYSMLGSKQE